MDALLMPRKKRKRKRKEQLKKPLFGARLRPILSDRIEKVAIKLRLNFDELVILQRGILPEEYSGPYPCHVQKPSESH